MNSIEHRVEYGGFLSIEFDHHQLQGKTIIVVKILSTLRLPGLILRLRSGQAAWAYPPTQKATGL
jgi:hypothetical protein